MIKIDKHVPMPNIRGYRTYPWKEMKVGDSFFTDVPSIRQQASVTGRRLSLVFATRREGEGFRVWRVK